MNKSELIDAIAAKTGESKAASGRSLDAVLDCIKDALGEGNEVAISGFGSFKLAKRPAREGRNPATGATIKIPATVVPKFSPGAALKSVVAK